MDMLLIVLLIYLLFMVIITAVVVTTALCVVPVMDNNSFPAKAEKNPEVSHPQMQGGFDL